MLGDLLDPSDGIFVNVGGNTGEMVRDQNTGELKIVLGSSQPVGGGGGGQTKATAQGTPNGWFNNILASTSAWPVWVLPALIIAGIALIVAAWRD